MASHVPSDAESPSFNNEQYASGRHTLTRSTTLDTEISDLRKHIKETRIEAALRRNGIASIDDISAQIAALHDTINASSVAAGRQEEEWLALRMQLSEARSAHAKLAAEQHNVSSRLRYVLISELNEAIMYVCHKYCNNT